MRHFLSKHNKARPLDIEVSCATTRLPHCVCLRLAHADHYPDVYIGSLMSTVSPRLKVQRSHITSLVTPGFVPLRRYSLLISIEIKSTDAQSADL